MPRRWKPEDIQTMVRMRRYGHTFVEIGEVLGKKPNTVSNKYHNLMNPGRKCTQKHCSDPPKKPLAVGEHLIDYNRARRGFHVPKNKEVEYFDLLKVGVSRADAAYRLGFL